VRLYPPDVKFWGAARLGAKTPILFPKERIMETTVKNSECQEEPRILDEIHVEELAIDGICGVY
jgi:mycofactocin precursor